MKVLIPTDNDFEFERCKKMYEFYSPRVNDDATFEEVIENTFFYAFYDKDIITLCLYFYEDDDKLWMNGYGLKKKHLFHKKCFEKTLSWFNCDVWAGTKYRDVAWALVNCGFKRFDKNIYVYHR